MKEYSRIPPHVIAAVNLMLVPYGVSFSELEQKTVNSPKYMTAKQASLYCGLSAKTIRDKALANEFRSIRIGKSEKSRVLIDRVDFDRWLDSFPSGAKT
ncbi:MAG: helix-turn-helix domain-containing protein [Victivallales bacterium]|nr:helix-turn-helix domain-containing protein [Victivallales bacterium]